MVCLILEYLEFWELGNGVFSSGFLEFSEVFQIFWNWEMVCLILEYLEFWNFGNWEMVCLVLDFWNFRKFFKFFGIGKWCV